MDKELEKIVREAHSMGATESDLNQIVDTYKKKSISLKGSQFGSETLPFGSKPFQTQVDTKVPSVLTPKGKVEYQEQVKAFKPQAIAKEGQPKPPKKADGGGATAFMADLNRFNSSIFKLPRLTYDVASSITDAALQALNLQQDETNYDDIVAASGYTSPLSVLDRLGDYYAGKSNQYTQRQEKFDKGIIDSFTSGDIKGGGKQLWNNIAGSIPSMVGMAVTGGAGNIAKLGYAQKTLASALPFISGRNAELSQDKSIPKPVRVANSVLNGYSEVIFDQSFGATAMISKVIGDVFKNEGRDAAVKVAKDFTKGFATEAIKRIQPFTGTIKGVVEEMSTKLSQNIVDKYTINPDKDLMEGVLDAGLVGGVMTGGIGAVGTVAYSSSQKKKAVDLMKQREEIVDDLDNDNLPEDIKDDLSDKLSKIDESINKIDDDNEIVISKLSDEDKTVLKQKESKIQSIEQALQDESLSETAKETLADRLLKEQDSVDEILTKTKQQDAIQVETAGQVPVLTEAPVSEEVEQGKPKSKTEVIAEEGVKAEEVGSDTGVSLDVIVDPVNIELKNNKIEGKLFNEQESVELQKEIESKYNNSDTPINKRFGQENEDIRQNAFNYDSPAAQKNVNGVDVRIVEGLVEGKAYSGKRRQTYLLYADGKIAGKFYSLSDAKKVVNFIEANLVKSIPTQEQTPAQKVEQLRAEEQVELKSAIPNADQYLTDGKVDEKKLTDPKDKKAFKKIYNKYDKLITPKLKEATKELDTEVEKLYALLGTPSGEPKFRLSDEVEEPLTSDIEAIEKEMNNMPDVELNFTEPEVSQKGLKVDPVSESNSLVKIAKKISDALLKPIQFFNGIPMITGMSDMLSAGKIKDSAGNTMDVEGGLLFNVLGKNKNAAWAGVTKEGAQAQYDNAVKLYNSNKELFDRLWSEGKLPDGHIPMAIMRMADTAVNSNEAIFRWVLPTIESLPKQNKINAMQAFIGSVQEKLNTKSKADIASAKNILNFIKDKKITSLDQFFKEVILDSKKRSKGISGSQLKLDNRSLIYDLIFAPKGIKTASKPTIKALLSGTDNSKNKIFTSDVIYSSIGEPSMLKSKQGEVVSVVGIDVKNGGVISVDHGNYGFGPKGKTIALIENPTHGIDVFPEWKAKSSRVFKKDKAGKVPSPESVATQTGGAFFTDKAMRGAKVFADVISDINLLIGKIRFAFPSVSVSTTQQEFDNIINSPDVRTQVSNGKIILGLTKDGKIYLNPAMSSLQTPIHEFGHIWIDFLRSKDSGKKGTDLLSKGLDLIRNTKEHKKAIEKYGNTEIALEEALVELMANKGATIIDAAKRSKFKSWMNATFKYIQDKFTTFKDLDASKISKIKLDDFINIGLADLFSGKEVSAKFAPELSESAFKARMSAITDINEIVKIGLDNGISKEAITKILIDKNFSEKEISSAIENAMGKPVAELKQDVKDAKGKAKRISFEDINNLIELGVTYIEESVKDLKDITFEEFSTKIQDEYGQDIPENIIRNIFKKSAAAIKLGVRRTPERIGTGEAVSDNLKEVANETAALYQKQDYKEIQDRLDSMSEADKNTLVGTLANVTGQLNAEGNVGVLAAIDLINMYEANGDKAGAKRVFDTISKSATAFAQLLRQYGQLKSSTPQGYVSILEKHMLDKYDVKLTDAQKQAIEKLYNDSKKAIDIEADALNNLVDDLTDVNYKLWGQTTVLLEDANRRLADYIDSLKPATAQSLFQKLTSIVQGNLLTLKSLLVNPVSNAAQAGTKLSGNEVANLFDFIINTTLKTGKTKISGFDPLAIRLGGKAFTRGLSKANRMLIKGATSTDLAKIDVAGRLKPVEAWKSLYKSLRGKQSIEFVKTIEDLAEGTIGVPANLLLRLLPYGDLPRNEQVKIAKLIEIGRNKFGLKGKELEVFTLKPDPESLAEAELEGDKSTLQESNLVYKTINDFINSIDSKGDDKFVKGLLSGIKFIIRGTQAPFLKTPINYAFKTIRFTNPIIPYSQAVYHMVKAIKAAKDIKNPLLRESAIRKNQSKLTEYLGEAVIAQSIMSAALILIGNGLVTGSAPEEDKDSKERNLMFQSLGPNMINISGLKRLLTGGDPTYKPGDTAIAYNALGIFGAQLGISSNTLTKKEKENIREKKFVTTEGKPFYEEDKGFYLSSIMAMSSNLPASLNYTLNQGFAQGTGTLLASISDNEYSKWSNQMVKTLVTGLAVPNTVYQSFKAGNDYSRNVYTEDQVKDWANIVKERYGNLEGLPIKYDMFGKPIKLTPEGSNPYVYHLIDIFRTQKILQDKNTYYVFDLYKKTGDKSVIPSSVKDVIDEEGGLYEKLTSEQKSELQRIVGEERAKYVNGDRGGSLSLKNYDPTNDSEVYWEKQVKKLKSAYKLGLSSGKRRFEKEILNKTKK